MQIELWPIEKPIPYARNARKLSDTAIDKVAASLKEFGWRQPIVVDSEGVIIAGHTRLLAAKKLGLGQVPVHVATELTAGQVKAYRLMDNRSHDESSWDFDLLGPEMLDLKDLALDLSLTGFDEDELAGLLVEGIVGLTDEDEVPEAPEEPVTQLSDLWILGKHRLLCGDSTKREDVERLMNGEKADMVFTDPPYGSSVVKGSQVGGGGATKFGKVGGGNWVDSHTYAEIANDDSTETAERFYQCVKDLGVPNAIVWGGNYFANFLPGSRCWLVWDKQNTGNFSDVELAWTSFTKGARLYSWMWNGLSRKGDRTSELQSRIHHTQKPVGLFEQIFKDFPFRSCLDGFLGSGSTLIACEKTGRTCYGMELAPAYCDVILTRWQNFTGKRAGLAEDGRTFEQVKEDRLAIAA